MKVKMPKVSVIVPVYNVEKYIDKSLKSLVSQTLEEIEIIIVNDGSTDSSKQIIDKYLEKYPTKIKYFEKQNGGLSSARNFGLNYATGEYIAFLDSDDYVEKEMYQEMYTKAKVDNADMVECDFLWEYLDFDYQCGLCNQSGQCSLCDNYKVAKIKKDKRRKYKDKREMMRKPRVVAWNKLIKREIIMHHEVRFPEGLIYEDLEFFYKLIPYLNKISYVEKYFIHYIQRTGSILNSQTEKVGDIFKILDNIVQYYRSLGIYDKYSKELKYMYRRILLGSSMKRILKLEDKKLKKELVKESFVKMGTDTFFAKCQFGDGYFFCKMPNWGRIPN